MNANNNNIFNRDFFVNLAKEFHLNASAFRRLGHSYRHSQLKVRGKMLEKLIELQEQFERLEVMGEDEYRGFYFEVSRPTPEEWADAEDLIVSEDFENEEEFLDDWRGWNPLETHRIHVSSTRYKEYKTLYFTDRKHTQFAVVGEHPDSEGKLGGYYNEWDDETLSQIFGYLQKLIEAIISDVDGFNRYVADHLPYQQRDGRIARKTLCQIEPRFRLKVEDRDSAIKALEYSKDDRFLTPPFENMTIRRYCKYFRIAHEAFEAENRRRDPECRTVSIPDDVPEGMQDIAYYKQVKFVRMDGYDVDSPADFKRFSGISHFGELGFSRLDICASDYDQPGWVITLSNSYSAYVDTAIDVATALFKAGAPLKIYDAEKLLKILLEEDYVRLITDSFHDYMNHHEEGTVYQLPWEHQCGNDNETFLSLKQYQEIIALAEWEKIEKVKTK